MKDEKKDYSFKTVSHVMLAVAKELADRAKQAIKEAMGEDEKVISESFADGIYKVETDKGNLYEYSFKNRGLLME